MKLDPNEACANEEERLLWAIVHDFISHPLMVLCMYAGLSLRFHTWTSNKAWPRPKEFVPSSSKEDIGAFETVLVEALSPGIYRVHHPSVSHAFTTNATSPSHAAELASDWFWMLAEEFGDNFMPKRFVRFRSSEVETK